MSNPQRMDWKKFRPVPKFHQFLYRIGLGPVLGRVILILTTTGRKTGLKRHTSLQYEEMEGNFVLGSARGTSADWFRNIEMNSQVEIQVKNWRFQGEAETVTDPARIADFMEYRLKKHPFFMGLLMQRIYRLPKHPSRDQLLEIASMQAMVIVHPVKEMNS